MKSPRGGVGRSARHARTMYLGNQVGGVCERVPEAEHDDAVRDRQQALGGAVQPVSFGSLKSVGSRPIMLEAVKLIKLLAEDVQHRRVLALQEQWTIEIDEGATKSGSRFRSSHNSSAEDDEDDEAVFARDGCVPPLIELVCVRLAPVALSHPSLTVLTSFVF